MLYSCRFRITWFLDIGSYSVPKGHTKFGLLHPEMHVRKVNYLGDSKLSILRIFIINYIFNTPHKGTYTIQHNRIQYMYYHLSSTRFGAYSTIFMDSCLVGLPAKRKNISADVLKKKIKQFQNI